MSISVKICGITDFGSGEAAVTAGADAVGFVFHPGSPRYMTPERARAIAERLPRRVEKVAVFLRPSADEIAAVLSQFDADVLQADAGYLPPVSIDTLPVIRQTAAFDPDSMPVIVEGRGRFMLEGPQSGSGVKVDWDIASTIAARGQMTLGGGLTPSNVADAIRIVSPAGVDVSSGVESAPGVKSPELIREFVRNVRAAERMLATP